MTSDPSFFSLSSSCLPCRLRAGTRGKEMIWSTTNCQPMFRTWTDWETLSCETLTSLSLLLTDYNKDGCHSVHFFHVCCVKSLQDSQQHLLLTKVIYWTESSLTCPDLSDSLCAPNMEVLIIIYVSQWSSYMISIFGVKALTSQEVCRVLGIYRWQLSYILCQSSLLN